ncbi:hypothetical protein NN561_017110 [Cricetulus griseus]
MTQAILKKGNRFPLTNAGRGWGGRRKAGISVPTAFAGGSGDAGVATRREARAGAVPQSGHQLALYLRPSAAPEFRRRPRELRPRPLAVRVATEDWSASNQWARGNGPGCQRAPQPILPCVQPCSPRCLPRSSAQRSATSPASCATRCPRSAATAVLLSSTRNMGRSAQVLRVPGAYEQR